MAYVVWRVLMKKYSKVRLGIHRNANSVAVAPARLTDPTAREQQHQQHQQYQQQNDTPLDTRLEDGSDGSAKGRHQPKHNVHVVIAISNDDDEASASPVDESNCCPADEAVSAPKSRSAENLTSSSARQPRISAAARSLSEPVVLQMTARPTDTATSTMSASGDNHHQHHIQPGPKEQTAVDVRRTKSKVRTYLKKCRDTLIGRGSTADTSSTATIAPVGLCTITHHERIQQLGAIAGSSASQPTTSWYVDETSPDDVLVEMPGQAAAEAAAAAAAAGLVVAGCANLSDAKCEEDVDADGVVGRCRHGGGGAKDAQTPIDLTGNNVVCQTVRGRRQLAATGSEDRLSQSSADTVLDMEALIGQTDRLIDVEQQQQQQPQRNEERRPYHRQQQQLHTDGMEATAIAQLVDRYLGDLYADYAQQTRTVLVRQARDLLVCTFYGDLLRFEGEFLQPAAKMLRMVIGCSQSATSSEPDVWRPHNWPLTHRQAVLVHLGNLDESLLRIGDVYFCIVPKSAAAGRGPPTNGPKANGDTDLPELCATWRCATLSAAAGGLTRIEQKPISLAAIGSASPARLAEMLVEELPHLLKSLLVGVEHAINRVPLDELSVFHPSETTAALSQHNAAAAAAAAASSAGRPSQSSTSVCSNSTFTSTSSSLTSSSGGAGGGPVPQHSKLLLSPLGSPKCGLKRREMLNKNKLSNKYALKRMTSKTDATATAATTTSDTTVSGHDHQQQQQQQEPPLSNLPLFCLGRSFPHIDSDDDESGDDASTIKPDSEVRLPQDVVAPRSILDLSEKLLLTSGIYLPGTRDIKGASIITVEAGPLLRSGVNCYEIATVLLYYSTIPLNPTFTIHTIATVAAELAALDLLDASLHLLHGNLQVSQVLVSLPSATADLALGTAANNQRHRLLPSSQIAIVYATAASELLAHMLPAHVPLACGGPHTHCQRRWRDFFICLEPLKAQCLAAGRRLVAVMGEIRASDHQGQPSRRQLFAQHRALSRALMDPDLQNLRRKGQAMLMRLRELQATIVGVDGGVGQTDLTESGAGAEGRLATLASPDGGAEDEDAEDGGDVGVRLNEVITIYEEVDRAARRLEHLTEQRRERLRELTRQRTLEDEINELGAWIRDDGEVALERFAKVPLECETLIKDHEQEFEKFYFISMKNMVKGQDLQNASVDIANLNAPARTVRDHLAAFGERLERTRERIEGAARLHHLLGLRLKDDAGIQQEMERLAHKIGVPGLVEMCRRDSAIGKPTTESAETSEVSTAKPVGTSTPKIVPKSGPVQAETKRGQLANESAAAGEDLPDFKPNNSAELCSCWRESSGNRSKSPEPQLAAAQAATRNNFQSNRGESDDDDDGGEADEENEEDEEEHSKMADSGLGYCERCEGNGKMTRACSCQSFDDPTNTSSKSNHSDDLEEECFEGNLKQMLDFQSPLQPNAHLYCYSSNMDLPELDNSNGLDPKTQKTLLFIMREMIGTERDYVRSLRYIIDNYTDELNREDIPQAMRGQRNVIFGNVEKICEFHQQHFLRELEQYEQHPLKVGAAFLAHEAKFYLYALYNKNKPKSDSLMSEYGSRFFKTKQIELDDKMDLASYLLKPVQRMGKYALLLQQLMKAVTSVQGPSLQKISEDIEELQRAEEMVRFQLRHGNDLLAMDSLRDCDVNVKEQGRLLRQNEFLVWQGRGGKKALRQVFLFEELVLFSKARRFPDRKNLDIYLYKNSIKTADIGLTACADDESPNKFEIWYRKRKPEDTWTLQCCSEDVKNAWTEEVTKLLWSQARRNREVRLAEMSSMGIGNKPCLDIRPSGNQINDRSITISQLEKTPKFRNSFSGTVPELKSSSRRPNSIISLGSSFSSGTSSSSLSTSASSSGSLSARCKGSNSGQNGLELIKESSPPLQQSTMYGRKHHNQRSTTLRSQLSMESGILTDMTMSPTESEHEHGHNLLHHHHNPLVWPTCMQKKHTSSSLSTSSASTSTSSAASSASSAKSTAGKSTTSCTATHSTSSSAIGCQQQQQQRRTKLPTSHKRAKSTKTPSPGDSNFADRQLGDREKVSSSIAAPADLSVVT